jgi:hypothetical protein
MAHGVRLDEAAPAVFGDADEASEFGERLEVFAGSVFNPGGAVFSGEPDDRHGRFGGILEIWAVADGQLFERLGLAEENAGKKDERETKSQMFPGSKHGGHLTRNIKFFVQNINRIRAGWSMKSKPCGLTF